MLPDLVQPLLGMLLVPHWAPWVRQLQLVRQQPLALATWRRWACWQQPLAPVLLLLLLARCLVFLPSQQPWEPSQLTQLPRAQRQVLMLVLLQLLLLGHSLWLHLLLQVWLSLTQLRQQTRQQLLPLPCAAHLSVLSSSWPPTATAATQGCCLRRLTHQLLPVLPLPLSLRQRRPLTAAAGAAARQLPLGLPALLRPQVLLLSAWAVLG